MGKGGGGNEGLLHAKGVNTKSWRRANIKGASDGLLHPKDVNSRVGEHPR